MSERAKNGSDARVALVTGGSRGIGAAICRRLASTGTAVLVAARGRDACVELADELTSNGGVAWPLVLDVTDPESIARATREARELAADVGPISWLVNNAGMAVSAPLLPKAPPEVDPYEAHFRINFHGARRMAEALLPEMKAAGYGRVVNVASSAGLRGYAYVAAYCASKFALVGYTLAAGAELAGSGVTFNAVCPHYVDSPMLDRSIETLIAKTGRSADEARDFFRNENPGGELVRPDEIAETIAQLLEGDANAMLVELDGANRIEHTPNISWGERPSETV